MPDLNTAGKPNERRRKLEIAELKVNLHGLEHQRMRYELDIDRWEDSITEQRKSIAATDERIAELTAQIKELESNG